MQIITLSQCLRNNFLIWKKKDRKGKKLLHNEHRILLNIEYKKTCWQYCLLFCTGILRIV